ncbi:putative rare lipoprotein A [[Synechococcus] sp. NIES-970]|uniref:septal ring lytic transglycosylase RlpA family protein n=1 Tax=Picosynechococcus sp. NKBG15041c TaxID=1407650 RepID=UPI00041748F0|nr:septal ring lytic transglycosylase RlpA family protein [Picosynechococcus sp. NKBG15041c]BAW95770.1 putative rare lipoprotein A [[Synechococcus] sp. NIES-970]
MTLNRNHLLALSAVFTTLAPLGLTAAPTLANQDTSSGRLAQNQILAAAQRSEPIATLFSYPQEERTATTLYVNQLPVLTFLDSDDLAPDTTPAIAQQVSQELNSLVTQADFDATKFTASWEGEGQYALQYDNEPLVTLDDAVFLADRTGNTTQDALIAVNRFRRILGGAEPIAEIANAPKAQNDAGVGLKVQRSMQGSASWYGPGFHGRRTASGEPFNQYAMTAAHKTLPFGTRVRVTNLRNNRSVVVRINDRGPFTPGRIIDLSRGSAEQIGLVSSGVANVRIDVLN